MTDEMPDWPPQVTAIGVPDGTFRHGSTGQKFVANKGQWVRVRKPASVATSVMPDEGEATLRNIGECAPLDGKICRRNYPFRSSCTRFGGVSKCLEDIRSHSSVMPDEGAVKS